MIEDTVIIIDATTAIRIASNMFRSEMQSIVGIQLWFCTAPPCLYLVLRLEQAMRTVRMLGLGLVVTGAGVIGRAADRVMGPSPWLLVSDNMTLRWTLSVVELFGVEGRLGAIAQKETFKQLWKASGQCAAAVSLVLAFHPIRLWCVSWSHGMSASFKVNSSCPSTHWLTWALGWTRKQEGLCVLRSWTLGLLAIGRSEGRFRRWWRLSFGWSEYDLSKCDTMPFVINTLAATLRLHFFAIMRGGDIFWEVVRSSSLTAQSWLDLLLPSSRRLHGWWLARFCADRYHNFLPVF